MTKDESKIRTAIKHKLYQQFAGSIYLQINHNDNKTAYGMKGTPDINGTYKGVAFWIEVKTDKGKLSSWQKARIRQIRSAGGYAITATKPEQAVDLINRIEQEWDL